jgi:hypothetical protein
MLTKVDATDILLTAEIDYWALSRWSKDALVVQEREASDEDDKIKSATITPDRLLQFLADGEVLALVRQIRNEYHRAALAGLAAGDNETDYDASTADLIVQQIVLGEVVYG